MDIWHDDALHSSPFCRETFYFAGVNDEDHVWDRDAGLGDVRASACHKSDIIAAA